MVVDSKCLEILDNLLCASLYLLPLSLNSWTQHKHSAPTLSRLLLSQPMAKYGMPFFLEDKTGLLTGSDFVDLHDRMHLSLRQTSKDSMHTAYMIYDFTSSLGSGAFSRPSAALDFGPNNTLGTVSFGTGGGHVAMKNYLYKPSALAKYVTL